MSARGWLLFAAMSVIWGIPYLLIKIALEGLSVPVLVLARTLIGAVVLLPLALSRANIRCVLAHGKPVLAFAFFEIIAAWLLLSNAERHLTSSTTGLLIAASPIIAAVLDRVSGGTHRLGAIRSTGLAVGLTGVAVLAGPGLSGGGAWPVAQVLLVATCYAIAPIIAARHLADVAALPLTASCLAFAALVYAVPAALSWPTEVPGTRVLVATALLAVVCTALAFVVFFALIREVGPTRAVVFTYVNPAVALAAGVIVLAEPLTLFNVAGLALVLIGSVLATRQSAAEQAR
ncbi:DMT family transporter [Mycolicibacterium fluoranthenivorans]|uniref:DMT family transporter n=1 Tax=Mycolicibacterium fluoranthenivorans TaxID=258505 RepID=A0A7G8P884_9MYCO|nr:MULTISPECIES: DMT family transporter [Mycobacteriaceae]MCV7256288.1 DMT family transporter [Mycobacterium hackensackense]QNJ90550.1 DMT family transporter [Mycolicibacterium fluoranthenivorans]